MKTIELTRGYVALVDDVDFARVSALKWRAVTWKHNRVIHAMTRAIKDNGKETTISMHRFILSAADSKIPIDHRDRNGLNNQRSNLRVCTTSQNTANSVKCRTPKTSIYKGVCFEKKAGSWMATIQTNHRSKRLGNFSTQEEAARAYDREAMKLFGEFAFVNFRNEFGVADNPA